MTNAAEDVPVTSTDITGTSGRRKGRVPLWASFVVVALVAALVAAPVSVLVYVSRQHHNQQQQLALASWWGPVSRHLENCANSVQGIKNAIDIGAGTQVQTQAQALATCVATLPSAKAPNDAVNLALGAAVTALNGSASQALHLGQLMGSKTFDQANPDQALALTTLAKQFGVAQVTLLSLQSVVRQAAGQLNGTTLGP